MSFRQLHTTLCRFGSVARPLGLVVLVGALLGVPPAVRAQQVDEPGADPTRRFYQDDPLWLDPDTNDVPPVSEFELFEDYDFVHNSFGHPGGPAGRTRRNPRVVRGQGGGLAQHVGGRRLRKAGAARSTGIRGRGPGLHPARGGRSAVVPQTMDRGRRGYSRFSQLLIASREGRTASLSFSVTPLPSAAP